MGKKQVKKKHKKKKPLPKPYQKLCVNVSNVSPEWFESSKLNIRALEKKYQVTISWKVADTESKAVSDTTTYPPKDDNQTNHSKPTTPKRITFTILEDAGRDSQTSTIAKQRLLDCVKLYFGDDPYLHSAFLYKFYLLDTQSSFEQYIPEGY